MNHLLKIVICFLVVVSGLTSIALQIAGEGFFAACAMIVSVLSASAVLFFIDSNKDEV